MLCVNILYCTVCITLWNCIWLEIGYCSQLSLWLWCTYLHEEHGLRCTSRDNCNNWSGVRKTCLKVAVHEDLPDTISLSGWVIKALDYKQVLEQDAHVWMSNVCQMVCTIIQGAKNHKENWQINKIIYTAEIIS